MHPRLNRTHSSKGHEAGRAEDATEARLEWVISGWAESAQKRGTNSMGMSIGTCNVSAHWGQAGECSESRAE